jgi:hypothetical protein
MAKRVKTDSVLRGTTEAKPRRSGRSVPTAGEGTAQGSPPAGRTEPPQPRGQPAGPKRGQDDVEKQHARRGPGEGEATQEAPHSGTVKAPQEGVPGFPRTAYESADPLQTHLIDQRRENPRPVTPLQSGMGETQPGVPPPGLAEAVREEGPKGEGALPKVDIKMKGDWLTVGEQRVNMATARTVDVRRTGEGTADVKIVTDAGERTYTGGHGHRVAELIGK